MKQYVTHSGRQDNLNPPFLYGVLICFISHNPISEMPGVNVLLGIDPGNCNITASYSTWEDGQNIPAVKVLKFDVAGKEVDRCPSVLHVWKEDDELQFSVDPPPPEISYYGNVCCIKQFIGRNRLEDISPEVVSSLVDVQVVVVEGRLMFEHAGCEFTPETALTEFLRLVLQGVNQMIAGGSDVKWFVAVALPVGAAKPCIDGFRSCLEKAIAEFHRNRLQEFHCIPEPISACLNAIIPMDFSDACAVMEQLRAYTGKVVRACDVGHVTTDLSAVEIRAIPGSSSNDLEIDVLEVGCGLNCSGRHQNVALRNGFKDRAKRMANIDDDAVPASKRPRRDTAIEAPRADNNRRSDSLIKSNNVTILEKLITNEVHLMNLKHGICDFYNRQNLPGESVFDICHRSNCSILPSDIRAILRSGDESLKELFRLPGKEVHKWFKSVNGSMQRAVKKFQEALQAHDIPESRYITFLVGGGCCGYNVTNVIAKALGVKVFDAKEKVLGVAIGAAKFAKYMSLCRNTGGRKVVSDGGAGTSGGLHVDEAAEASGAALPIGQDVPSGRLRIAVPRPAAVSAFSPLFTGCIGYVFVSNHDQKHYTRVLINRVCNLPVKKEAGQSMQGHDVQYNPRLHKWVMDVPIVQGPWVGDDKLLSSYSRGALTTYTLQAQSNTNATDLPFYLSIEVDTAYNMMVTMSFEHGNATRETIPLRR